MKEGVDNLPNACSVADISPSFLMKKGVDYLLPNACSVADISPSFLLPG